MFLPLKKIRRAPWQADGAFESHILNEVLLKKVCAILGVSRSNWNLEMFFFWRRRENRSTRRKTSRSKGENQEQTQPTYDAESRESNPGHIGGRRVISPLRCPCYLLENWKALKKFGRNLKRSPHLQNAIFDQNICKLKWIEIWEVGANEPLWTITKRQSAEEIPLRYCKNRLVP